jgi:DNA-binding NtrC family response regulator
MSEEAAVRREAVGMNILIVDDEQTIRETCSVVAEQCGMKASSVATAEQAYEVLEQSAVDILLTDLLRSGLMSLDLSISLYYFALGLEIRGLPKMVES